VDQDAIIQYITRPFEGLDILRSNDGPGAGDAFFYYDPLRETFVKLIGHPPTEDATSAVGYDFAALDRLMRRPVYAPQSWLCVLNPTAVTFENIKPLLVEAYSRQRADVERGAR
jgi:uncharacterized protein DUF6194